MCNPRYCTAKSSEDSSDAGTTISSNEKIIGNILALELVRLENKGNNQTIQTESLRKDQNQNDTDEQLGLTSVGAHTSVT